MNRHAYLIIAHKNMEQLKRLISFLDDARNDIFLMIDRKCREFSKADFHCSNAGLYFADRMDIVWGGVFTGRGRIASATPCKV